MTPTLMWEARAVPGRREDLLDWARETTAAVLAGAQRRELFVAGDDRVVVIALGADLPVLPDPPPELVTRAPHGWTFTRVDDR